MPPVKEKPPLESREPSKSLRSSSEKPNVANIGKSSHPPITTQEEMSEIEFLVGDLRERKGITLRQIFAAVSHLIEQERLKPPTY